MHTVHTIITVVIFAAFILMGLILYFPRQDQPYKDAEKLALKDDDELVSPRQQNKKTS